MRPEPRLTEVVTAIQDAHRDLKLTSDPDSIAVLLHRLNRLADELNAAVLVEMRKP